MKNKSYQQLIVWQKADELAGKVYDLTDNWPKSELYGLTSQLRRAAISVVLNIVEGTGRQSPNDTRRFLEIAIGSLRETDYLFGFCRRRGLIDDKFLDVDDLIDQTAALLWKFYKAF